jgi:ORF6N domain
MVVMKATIASEVIQQKIMVDADLALFYQVETRDLNKAVSRNIERFPEDFMFQPDLDISKNLVVRHD